MSKLEHTAVGAMLRKGLGNKLRGTRVLVRWFVENCWCVLQSARRSAQDHGIFKKNDEVELMHRAPPGYAAHRNYPLCHGTESQHNDRGWSLSCGLKLKLDCETCRPAEPLTCFFLLQLDDDKGPITGFCPEG